MQRAWSIAVAAFVASFLACGGAETKQAAPAAKTTTTSGRVGSHGMVAFGTPSAAFVSHIPMFGPPHDVQAVVAGSFGLESESASASSLPASLGDRLFTFLPDRMSLDAFRAGSLAEIHGQLFLGNFEAGGQALPSRVRFKASRVVHDHVLDAGAQPSDLGYLLVGTREETYAVHRITRPPSFDEVLRVELGGDAPTADLAHGALVHLAGVPDAMANRLGLGHEAKPVQAGTGTGPSARAFTMKPIAMLSCLVGPEFSEPCK